MLDIHLDIDRLRTGLQKAEAALRRFAKRQSKAEAKARRKAALEASRTLRRHLEELSR